MSTPTSSMFDLCGFGGGIYLQAALMEESDTQIS